MTSWQTPLCPFTIEFAPGKLDDIRIAVVDSFYKVPRGGIEIGGVLFGKRENGRLLVHDYRRIETEYLTGPSFRLSENDQAGLRTLLQETTFPDPDLRPVGWFHSHTRSGIHLSESDLGIYHQYFPEPWQIAMVLKPDTLGGVRGGYFFRQATGLVKSDAPVEEFALQPYFGKKQAPADDAVLVEKPEAPVTEAPPIADQLSPSEPPLTFEEPLLFRSISQTPSWSTKKRVFVFLLAAAAIAAGVAGYWAGTH
jgi:proteasome lid subunit RPN8/RPN11